MFVELVCFIFDSTCRALLITSILSTWSGDNLCLLLFNIIPLKLKSRSVPEDVAGIDKSFRARHFKRGNFADANSVDQKWSGFSLTIDDGKPASRYWSSSSGLNAR